MSDRERRHLDAKIEAVANAFGMDVSVGFDYSLHAWKAWVGNSLAADIYCPHKALANASKKARQLRDAEDVARYTDFEEQCN
jgi:hypothetical protein